MRCLLVACVCLGICSARAARAEEIPVPQHRPDRVAEVETKGQVRTAEDPAEPAKPPEPQPIHREACPALFSGAVEGRLAPPLVEGDCGESSPVQITAIDGIPLTGKPLVTCAMAGELGAIVRSAATIARETLGAELKAIVTGPGYECRWRNRAAEGKLSEHAFANALDIASFKFSGGREISVEAHWPHLAPSKESAAESPVEATAKSEENPVDPPKPPQVRILPAERADTVEAKFLVAVHAEACKRFTTVLGPDANAEHHAHFHFDLGCHGKDCKYTICE